MKLYDIAHSRAGDKGDILNLSLIPYDDNDYDLLRDKVTAEQVEAHLSGIVKGDVVRYDLPNLKAFNFVCYQTLQGGVTTSLAVDTHGKSLSSAFLEMEIEK